MKLSNIPLIREDIISRLTKDKALIISTNKLKGYILENPAFNIWKLINNHNSVKEIVYLCTKKNNKNEIIQILKDLEKLKLIYFKD
jgi:hypothetical protein